LALPKGVAIAGGDSQTSEEESQRDGLNRPAASRSVKAILHFLIHPSSCGNESKKQVAKLLTARLPNLTQKPPKNNQILKENG
jgi:hypothetical protein